MAYYGVFIPNEKKNAVIEEELVFRDRTEAFQMLKKVRESRVKAFDTYYDAFRFSKCGLEISPESETSTILISVEVNGNQISNPNTNGSCDKTAIKALPLVGEKTSTFRGPTSQELVKFRKMIEQADMESARNLIWINPRYLVSSGDTPTILKESFRYNALHVASIEKNAKMAKLILETVSNPEFIKLLHGKDDDRTANEVSEILLDLYLNTPEKGRSETPLHLASKFGAVEVVEVLKSYQKCESTKNSDGLLPKDIVCSRIENAAPEVKRAIQMLLQGKFYVPVIRSIDNSAPPFIGEPFTEAQVPDQEPPKDPRSPPMEIFAIAGPMHKEQADTFRKRWKTPPRGLGSPASFLKSPNDDHSPITGSPLPSYPNAIVRQRCTPIKIPESDLLSSIEKTSRRLFETTEDDAISTNAKTIMFKNYRDRSHDDSLNESLNATQTSNAFKDFSFNESQYNSPGFKERNLKLADADKGLEVIGRGLAKDQRIPWTERWTFLNEYIDISSIEGLTKFENYLQERLDDRMKPPPLLSLAQRKQQMSTLPITPISKISQKLTKLNIEKEHDDSFSHIRASTPSSPNAFHAYLCVEKSCQIYANRLLKPITQNPTNIVTVNDVLVGELNRLKSLICSYKQDLRFFAIDFAATHSRFAHIIVALLNNDPEYKEHNVCDILQNTLTLILQAKEKSAMNASKNGTNQNDHSKSTTQLICFIRYLLKRLSDFSNIIPPEVLTKESDCADIWNGEEKCDCEWINASSGKVNRNMQRKTHRLSETFSDFCDKLNLKCDEPKVEDQEEEFYWSVESSDDDDSEFNDDVFYTPPQSPILEYFDNSGPKTIYDNFIYGQDPTKMDNDVMKALHNVDIDKNLFPNVYQWYNAVMKYSLEERARFAQPVSSNGSFIKSPSPLQSPGNAFGRTLIKSILPRIGQFQLKPSKFTSKP